MSLRSAARSPPRRADTAAIAVAAISSSLRRGAFCRAASSPCRRAIFDEASASRAASASRSSRSCGGKGKEGKRGVGSGGTWGEEGRKGGRGRERGNGKGTFGQSHEEDESLQSQYRASRRDLGELGVHQLLFLGARLDGSAQVGTLLNRERASDENKANMNVARSKRRSMHKKVTDRHTHATSPILVRVSADGGNTGRAVAIRIHHRRRHCSDAAVISHGPARRHSRRPVRYPARRAYRPACAAPPLRAAAQPPPPRARPRHSYPGAPARPRVLRCVPAHHAHARPPPLFARTPPLPVCGPLTRLPQGRPHGCRRRREQRLLPALLARAPQPRVAPSH